MAQIKLIIKLHAVSETEERRQIVLYVPRSKKRELSPPPSKFSNIPSNKRCKVSEEEGGKKEEVHHANPTNYLAKGKSSENREKEQSGSIISRIGYVEKEKKQPQKQMRVATKKGSLESEECERKKYGNICTKKMVKVKQAADEVSAYPTKKSSAVGKSGRTSYDCGAVEGKVRVGSRTGLEECKMKKQEEKKKVMVMQMDRYKKMQCWVMLKRLMTGRDSWVFKQKYFLKGLDIFDKKKNSSKPKIKSELGSTQTIMKPPIGLEDIESKLNKLMYTEIDEFADDIRLVFSYAMLHPPRHEIYKIARRLSDDFEHSWKSMKDKWSREERKKKKIY